MECLLWKTLLLGKVVKTSSGAGGARGFVTRADTGDNSFDPKTWPNKRQQQPGRGDSNGSSNSGGPKRAALAVA